MNDSAESKLERIFFAQEKYREARALMEKHPPEPRAPGGYCGNRNMAYHRYKAKYEKCVVQTWFMTPWEIQAIQRTIENDLTGPMK